MGRGRFSGFHVYQLSPPSLMDSELPGLLGGLLFVCITFVTQVINFS